MATPHPAKWCSKCETEKPIEDFASDTSTKDGLNSYCKSCRAEWARNDRKENAATYRDSHLKTRYGISSDEYDAMLERQGGRCAICGGVENRGNGDNLHVDHDHVTSNVRGILCGTCNNGIGKFDDNLHLLLVAAAYLENA